MMMTTLLLMMTVIDGDDNDSAVHKGWFLPRSVCLCVCVCFSAIAVTPACWIEHGSITAQVPCRVQSPLRSTAQTRTEYVGPGKRQACGHLGLALRSSIAAALGTLAIDYLPLSPKSQIQQSKQQI